jgi:hypothetical protein
MATLPSNASSSLLDWVDDVPANIRSELKNRYDELTTLESEQVQMGTSVPQLYGSLSRFIANPSTVSVETYKRMLDTDETIGAGIDFMNQALIARFGEYKHPVPEIEEFVRRAIDQMDGSWHEMLDEMFSAEWSGFSVTEQLWAFEHDFDGFPAFVPRKLVTYAPLTMVFAVNRHGEVLPDGIYQYQRFHNTFGTSYLHGIDQGDLNGWRPDTFASVGDFPYPIRIAADLTYLTVKIPKDKVIHLRSSSTGKFNNPYGRSILRRIYKSWVMKDAFLKMWIVAADKKGTPLVVGYAAPNDTVMEEARQHGEPIPQRADVAMANAFRNMHNSSFMVFPGKKGETYDIEAIQIQGDTNVYKDGVEYFNKAIMRGLLIPPLVLGGDGGGSFSLGQEHNKIFKQVIDGKLKVYKQNIIDQWVTKIIAYNFPKKMWEKHGAGEFLLEEFDPEVMEKLANIFKQLTDDGYMSPESQQDMDEVRQKMNLQPGPARAPMPEAEPEMGSIDNGLGPDHPSNQGDNDPGSNGGQEPGKKENPLDGKDGEDPKDPVQFPKDYKF